MRNAPTRTARLVSVVPIGEGQKRAEYEFESCGHIREEVFSATMIPPATRKLSCLACRREEFALYGE